MKPKCIVCGRITPRKLGMYLDTNDSEVYMHGYHRLSTIYEAGIALDFVPLDGPLPDPSAVLFET